MWRLLQAEFEYHKTRLWFAVLAAIAFLLANLMRDWGGVYGLQGVTMIIFYVAMIIIGTYDDREKRDRQQALLPVPLAPFSLSRLAFVVLLQSAFFVLWLIVFLLRHLPHDMKALWSMLSLQATMFIVVNSFIMYHDLGYFETKRYHLAFIATLGAIVAGLFFMEHKLIAADLFSFGPSKNKSPAHALALNAVAIFSFWLCHKIFVRRKSYLS